MDRRKNKDAKWKANIARSLRQKGNKTRKGAKKVVSKAVTKTAGAAGYALGRFGDKLENALDTKKGQKLVSRADKALTSKKGRKATGIVTDAVDKLDTVTKLKATGAATKGYVKGKVDAERKKKRK